MDSRTLKLILSLQDNASAELRKVSKELDTAERLTTAWDGTLKVVKRSLMAVGAAAIAGLGFGVKIAADLQTAEIGLTTLLGSADEARATVERLKLEAARTPFELRGLTQAAQLLTAVTKNGDQSIDILLDVGEGLAAMGKGQVELDRIIVNLQQIAAVGKAATIDIKQFAFAGLPIYEMLAETTGKNGEALGDFIAQGGVTFELLTKMFDEANDEGGRFFNAFVNQKGSFNQALSNMKDSLGIFFADIATSSGLMDRLTAGMVAISEVMGDWQGTLASINNYIKEHGLVISIVAGAIFGALLPALVAATISFGTLALAAAAAGAAILISLAPFIIAGALIAGAAYLIYTNWGGIKDFFSNLWATITETTSAAMTAIGSFISATWETIKNVFWTAVNFIIGAYATLFDFMFPNWQTNLKLMWDYLLIVFNAMSTFIGTVLAAIGGGISTAMGAIKTVWVSGWGFVEAAFITVWESIKTVFAAAKDYILDIMDKLLGPINKVIDAAKRAMELTGQALKSAGKSIKGGIQDIIDRGASITGKASGGAVTGGTSYIVGEQGPELFKPATGGTIVPNHDLGGNGGGLTVNVYGDVTGEELIEKVKRAMANDLKEMVRI